MESEVARYLTSNAKPCLGIDELIEGCDEDYRGATVLQVASSYGYLPMVRKLLIYHGVWSNQKYMYCKQLIFDDVSAILNY